METTPPKYKIGDFVRCNYAFYDFYYLYTEIGYSYLPHYGIIADLAWDEDWFRVETVYKIYCMDGEYRFFLEDEIEFP